MAKNTKERIIDAAIELFNVNSTGEVSTNHIAKEIGISPGNLYYHFQNKEEIIRAIFERMVADFHLLWSITKQQNELSFQELRSLLKSSFELEWKYRFFYRELIVLMKNDPDLKSRHSQIQQERMQQQRAFLQQLIDLGVLHDTVKGQLDALLKISWMISNYWLMFLESSGIEGITEELLEEGIDLIFTVFTPYFQQN
ncbi:TetR/AcrR family transcriptional regulator [Alkalihalobacillus oceani]|uniref:TetR/AcrR family transcriptional regulator n=1 Tax=Halalkalibacter oceani TaxID=1653776 RepID=UPI00203AE58B|nr:TetR/AcrR family transcriptional regulator [Halalkalibacter oceani]MCM3761571.1 TetR/AcrR family transcriptional regulator [Halalkalibacter oceani]